MASIINKINSGSVEYNLASTAYATCATAKDQAAKVAWIQGDEAGGANDFTLTKGVTVHVRFSNSNSAINPTLSINGGTAKSIKMYGSTAIGTSEVSSWKPGAVVAFTYDGTNWIMNTGLDEGKITESHLYHTLTDGAYYYDSYQGSRGFRIITENMLADTLRFQAVTLDNEEYWDYNSSSWKALNLNLSNLFDGDFNTSVGIPHANRKFRFTITANSGWPTTALIILAGSWFDSGTVDNVTGTTYKSIMTIETRSTTSDSWTTKATANFSTQFDGTCGYVNSNLHTGHTLYRITVELGSWATTTSSASLRNICILSNYAGSSLLPFKYDGEGNVSLLNKLKLKDRDNYKATYYGGGFIISDPNNYKFAQLDLLENRFEIGINVTNSGGVTTNNTASMTTSGFGFINYNTNSSANITVDSASEDVKLQLIDRDGYISESTGNGFKIADANNFKYLEASLSDSFLTFGINVTNSGGVTFNSEVIISPSSATLHNWTNSTQVGFTLENDTNNAVLHLSGIEGSESWVKPDGFEFTYNDTYTTDPDTYYDKYTIISASRGDFRVGGYVASQDWSTRVTKQGIATYGEEDVFELGYLWTQEGWGIRYWDDNEGKSHTIDFNDGLRYNEKKVLTGTISDGVLTIF